MARKRGPKTKFNETRGESFIRLAREGKTAPEIAACLGVSRRTLSNWMRRNGELLLAVRAARRLADRAVEAALFNRATGYSHFETKAFIYEGCVVTEDVVKHHPPDTTAAMFWLRNRQPKRWREKADGADVNVNNYSGLTDEQLDAKLAELEARRAPTPAPGNELAPMSEPADAPTEEK